MNMREEQQKYSSISRGEEEEEEFETTQFVSHDTDNEDNVSESEDKFEEDEIESFTFQQENSSRSEQPTVASSSSSPSSSSNDLGAERTFVLPEKEIPPPDYYDLTSPPPYSPQQVAADAVIYETAADIDDILIDGLPVGHPFLLIINLFLTLAFDFVGFLLTYLLATTHSARAGSRLGFGLTLIRYGLFIRHADTDQKYLAYKYYDKNITTSEIRAQNHYMSYLLMILGFLVVLFANADYYRVNKIRNLIVHQASSDPSRIV